MLMLSAIGAQDGITLVTTGLGRAGVPSLTVPAMLRDNSIFVDGGVQLFRKAGNTWLGFSMCFACNYSRFCYEAS